MDRALCPILVGREVELGRLEDALLAANRGDGQVVLLAGDAGMGKTRLGTELARRARGLGMAVLVGGCSEADLSLPYLPFLEAIGNQLAGAELESLRSKLGPMRRELAHLFPQLEPEDARVDGADEMQGKLRLFEAILALLGLFAADRGLLMVVEDLHWADTSTRELLDYFTRRLRKARILVLGTYRADEMHRRHPLLPMIQGWRRSSSASMVELGPLSPARVAQMVTAIFDLKEGVQDDTRDFLHQRSEGNPFVLEELLKAALDRGDIFRAESGWTRKAIAEMRLPESVRDTILLRLDRLQPDQVEVLRSAAVLGNDFDYPTLIGVAAADPGAVQTAVEASVQQQLLVDVPGRMGRYRFRHALTREAIYEDMILPRREALHARAADVLMAREGVSSVELCNHLLAGGRPLEAVPLAIAAARAAESSYAYAEAAELYEKVLSGIPAGNERGAFICHLGATHHRAGNPAQARTYLADGIRQLEAGGDHRQAAGFRLEQGRCSWELGQPVKAAEEYEAARRVLEEFGPSEELAMAYVRLAGMRIFDFDPAGAVELAERAIAVAEQAGSELPRIWATSVKGGALVGLGETERGLELLDRSFAEAQTRGLYQIAENTLFNSMVSRFSTYRAGEIHDRIGLFQTLPPSVLIELDVLTVGAGLAMIEGRFAESLASYRRAMEIAKQTGLLVFWRRSGIWAAEALLELGRLDEAERQLIEAGSVDEAQEKLFSLMAWQRLALLRGDQDEIRRTTLSLFQEITGRGAAHLRERGMDACAKGFAALGDVDGLERARAEVQKAVEGRDRPGRDRVIARHALATGDFAKAARLAAATEEFFTSRNYVADSLESRLLLSEALARTGDGQAQAVLDGVVADARRLGAVAILWQAARVASTSGLQMPDDERRSEEPVQNTTPGPVGERLVTVLFADVRGFTAMTQTAVPADLADRIATFQRWAITEVERNSGHVDKFAGDAVMATFNISGAQIDHAVHAIRCAIALRDKAALLQLPLGCGIATGPAVVGALAPGANVSVLGEATNLASRLQAKAGPGEVLISPEALRRSRPWLQSAKQDVEAVTLDLKGYPEPVVAHRLAP